MNVKTLAAGFVFVLGICGAPMLAQTQVSATKPVIGPVTGLELPRYVSVKKRVHARRGPSTKYRIDWIYQEINLPLRVEQEFGHWRRVIDVEGQGGWIHYAFLSNTRYVLFTGEQNIHYRQNTSEKPMATAQKGVVALIEKCELDWCLIEADGHKGWTVKNALWGVGASEVVK